jgi:hypothetical protein
MKLRLAWRLHVFLPGAGISKFFLILRSWRLNGFEGCAESRRGRMKKRPIGTDEHFSQEHGWAG